MAKRLTTLSLSLPELLRSRQAFVLPASQRAYGWSEDQLDRLLTDAGVTNGANANGIQPPAWLFLGTIYLADVPDGTTAIADGQQRIVTGLMLYAAARDLEEDAARRQALEACVETPGSDGRASTPRLRLRLQDAEFFQRWVLQRGATLRPYQHEDEETGTELPPPPLSESQNNILANRNLIVEKLRALGPDGRRKLLAFLEDASEFVVITAPYIADALNAYASTYKRGLKQAETDRLKFEIIGEAPVSIRTELAHYWDECEGRLGKDNLEELCGLILLQRTGAMAPADVQTPLMETFGLPAAARAFVEDTLVSSTNAYAELLANGETLTAYLAPGYTERARVRRIRNHIVTLMRTTHVEWRAPALSALTHLRSDLSLMETVFAGLERLAGVMMIVGHEPASMCQRYGELSSAIAANNKAGITTSLHVEAGLKTRARDLLLSSNFGQKPRYRLPVLLKLNDLFAGDTILVNVKEASCEHVLPQNVGKDNPIWHAAFRTSNGKAYTGHHFRHRLGNMTVLTHAENRDAAAKPYADKRLIFARSAFDISAHAAQTYDAWKAPTIEARTKLLYDMLAQHWDL